MTSTGASCLLLGVLGVLLCACNVPAGTTPDAAAGPDAAAETADAGEPPPPCDQLVQTGVLTELPPFPGSMSWNTRVLSLGSGSAAIVRTIAIPGMGPQSTVASTVAWTASWPPSALAPVELADRPYYLAAASSSDPSRIALLGTPEDGSPGMAFGFADPVAGGWAQILSIDPQGFVPAFLAANDGGQFFLGVEVSVPDNHHATVSHIGWIETAGSASYTGPIALSCARYPGFGPAAVATPGGWLLARSIFDSNCNLPNPLVTVTRYDGTTATSTVELESDPATPVGLLPRPGGAWLMYSSNSAAQAVRLGALGDVEFGPVPISIGTFAAVDGLDGGLVFASRKSDALDLTIEVTDDEGNVLASATLPLPSDLDGFNAFNVLFDAETRQVLVAVVLWGQDPGPSSNVHVARFTCE